MKFQARQTLNKSYLYFFLGVIRKYSIIKIKQPDDEESSGSAALDTHGWVPGRRRRADPPRSRKREHSGGAAAAPPVGLIGPRRIFRPLTATFDEP